jgi:hypothetical protein
MVLYRIEYIYYLATAFVLVGHSWLSLHCLFQTYTFFKKKV